MKSIHKRSFVALTTAFFLAFSAMPASTMTVMAATTANYRLGDVNADGSINSLDSMLVLQGGLSAEKKLAADVNQDALVTNADADLILEYRVGKTPVFNKASVSLNYASLSFTALGQSADIKASVTNGRGNMENTLKWEMEDEHIATFSNGVVTAKKVGSTNLKVTLLNGENFVCPIVVSNDKSQCFGIDVSTHQNTIDWNKVKQSKLYNYSYDDNGSYKKEKLSDTIDFAIIRSGYGRFTEPDGSTNWHQEDVQFDNNYAGTKAADIPVGVYHYSYANTPADAKNEALLCLNTIQGHSFEYPVFFDVEDKEMLTKPNNTKNSRAEMNAIINAFCEEIRKAGYYPAVYSGKNFITNYLDIDSLNYDLWVAQYWYDGYKSSGSSWEEEHERSEMWQYSSTTGGIGGIATNQIDANTSYVNYPKIIAASGLNKAQTDQSKSAIISGTAGLLFAAGLLK